MNLKDYIKQIIAERELQAKITERGISEEDIINYIYEEAKKVATGSASVKKCAIWHDDVANWIVHYVEDAYREDKEKGKHKEEAEEPKEDKEFKTTIEKQHEKLVKEVEKKKEVKPIKPIVYTVAKPKAPEGQEQLTWDSLLGGNSNE